VSSDCAIRTEHLSRSFAGFSAVDDMSLEIPTGGVRTIIGPNGAGKTTLFNLLSGTLPVTAGHIFLGRRNVTRLKAFERARLGLARSFQITNIFGRLSVAENVRLAVQAVSDGKANFFLPLKNARAIGAATDRILNDIGLWPARNARAENLSHGDQRRLEIGLVLASDPPVLLLDEPLAAMSPTETHETVALIQRISPDRTIMLVEHDIDVVMAISTTITVFQTGAVLASGTPEEIRANQSVQRAYLGEIA
jgi:branched-chain amino acid transport system ATP-binding protein